MSIAMAGIGVGGTIFSPIVTMLLEKYGWRHTYQIMALIVLVIALPAAFSILRKRPEDMGLKPYGSDEADTKVAAESSNKNGVRSFFRNAAVLAKILLLVNADRYALQRSY